ncbi:hypothetical protein K504DRAFT_471627 [Pleomassaria siparia CBS 279.74]|uniref:SET domain-containing protein n=1 Tax=Pleomassaria siparia CBS 279.74 TaxID=1314801 RepID=A0A6G1JZF6_9PLEO|nr:hypothetical protein K504DRAFT_471627 [Pleomassaria siparia CBS 279.74]
MTDVSSFKAHADPQPTSVAPYAAAPPRPTFSNGSPTLDGTIEEEESSTIKCICGFAEDDGNTVLCEKCDTWQHIVCYYESAQHVPDIHECADCLPRPVDTKGAAEKQRQYRELRSIGERKGKPKTATKSHKKRVKDPLGAVQPNGWTVHPNAELQYNSERKSGSPRDQPPPAKRPKTSHRASVSLGVISQPPTLAPGSRKRTSSIMYNGHSPVKSPTNPYGPSEEFSVEFMRLYRQPEPPTTTSNSYSDLGVANEISTWLNDRDALAEATGGLEPAQVFERIDRNIAEMEELAPVITRHTDEDPSITAHGLHPQWQFLTVETEVPQNGFLGELKGLIGRKEDYFSEPANRWESLRHPEPFVFFPPHLPVYIDTRQEGSLLRYTRRSCNPNVMIKILTQGSESGHHFCFVAKDIIHPGDELTIGWDIDAEIHKRLGQVLHNGNGLKNIEPWVACVLANFGGCACDTSRGRECLLERARRPNNINADPVQPLKAAKVRRIKKSQISPLSTGHATNSRAGSETFIREGPEEENADSRSTSGSHKSSSRDITPATHFSVDGGDLKMSDRERRKIQQQERLFEQLEYDEQHKGKRGKRHSAGSALNTPGLSSSVRRSSRPYLFDANADPQKQLGHSEASPSIRNPREHSNGVARKTSGNSSKTTGYNAQKSKPLYVDNYTQTDEDKASTAASMPSPQAKAKVMKLPVSFKRKLLQQALEDKLHFERMRSTSVKMEAKSPTAIKDVDSGNPSPEPIATSEPHQAIPEKPGEMEMDISPEPTSDPIAKEPPPPVKETSPARETTPAPRADVEMHDADEGISPKSSSPKIEEIPDAPIPEPSTEPSEPLIPPPTQLPLPPPPWGSATATASPTQPTPAPSTTPQKPVDLHLELPPKPDLTGTSAATNTVVTPGSVSSIVTGSAIAQSPVAVPQVASPFSSTVNVAVNPGPARKKLSLSAYTSRRAKLAQTTTGPSIAQVPTTSSPTMSNSSLPNQPSPPGKSVEPQALPAITEEVKPLQQTAST